MISSQTGCNRFREVVLLRFHGHCAPGVMGISDGEGEHFIGASEQGLTNIRCNLRDSRLTGDAATVFRRLWQYRTPWLQSRSGPAGRQMIQRLANVWNVLVSGGVNTQYNGVIIDLQV